MRRRTSLTTALALLMLGACFEGTGPLVSANVMLQAVGSVEDGELVITGTNGTLRITDIRLIVDELELEPAESHECEKKDFEAHPKTDDENNDDDDDAEENEKDVEDDEKDGDQDDKDDGDEDDEEDEKDEDGDDDKDQSKDCPKFETRTFFVTVPVDGKSIDISHADLPEGLYEELEFEVDDLELDDDEGEESDEIAELLETIRNEFPDWPEKASMMVEGTFTPTGGEPVSFRAYFEAEIEVELKFHPPLEITDNGETVVIEVHPELWFERDDGTVWDLSQFDFEDTGKLIEFELEIEDGFEVEVHD